ncbi:MAG: TauD/TfdA family dioxygenase [Acidimicrobiales bacterium]|nr:TauD/TfdA family dioxygenase [Acidimicrobiales bacterium]
MYRSYIDQTLSYFDRPAVGVPVGPVGGAAAWRAADLRAEDWLVVLDADQADAVAALGRTTTANGTPLAELGCEDLEPGPVAALTPLVDAARATLVDGLGFTLWRGLPVEALTAPETEAACWALGLMLGAPGAQNGEGDLLGHVTDYHDDPDRPLGREYRTTVDIDFHCDVADAVGLLCIGTPASGGESRLVSSVTVFDELLATHPDLAARLCEPAELDTRSDGEGFGHVPVTPVCFDGHRLRTFMHLGYFRSAARHPDVELDAPLADALDAWSAIASRPELHLDMELRVGDLQLCSNHAVAHARRAYVDDPAAPRHLLRLWLTL